MNETTPRSIGQWLILGLVLLYAGVLLIAPIVAIAQRALSAGLDTIFRSLTEPDVLHALQLTFLLTFAAVVINTVAGIITAWVLTRQRFVGRRLLNILVDIPFVFSPVIAGYALIVLFGREGWLTPTIIPIAFAWPGILLANVFVALPYVTREVGPVLAALDREPEEAAYTIGASRWVTFWRVIFPGIWPGVLYGVVLTLARTLGEFGAVAVIGGGAEGSSETATMYIIRAQNDRNEAGAYSVALLLCLIAIVVLLLMRLLRRSIGSERTYVNHSG
jgi:sulfate transport system permease protein